MRRSDKERGGEEGRVPYDHTSESFIATSKMMCVCKCNPVPVHAYLRRDNIIQTLYYFTHFLLPGHAPERRGFGKLQQSPSKLI